jgi:hypothetical protein
MQQSSKWESQEQVSSGRDRTHDDHDANVSAVPGTARPRNPSSPCKPESPDSMQGCLWQYRLRTKSTLYKFAPPSFDIDGKEIIGSVRHLALVGSPIRLDDGATEYSFEGQLVLDPQLGLRIEFQVNGEVPIIRFRHVLESDQKRTLSDSNGKNSLTVVLLIIWHILVRTIWHTIVPGVPLTPRSARSPEISSEMSLSTHSHRRFGADAPNI